METITKIWEKFKVNIDDYLFWIFFISVIVFFVHNRITGGGI